ncbi:TorD/DmsD family molecular chaperone [Bordetella petrii]|uniref:TorD/DmsD family molecular chaperone n=1 Tax=Bordetella petrii TaxID=94624 RepID=UPI001E558E2C|nr:molecular chaperone TorD family protein [Bordetella petrii]MCD0505993.1 molecular chaperone TorD family protein [Bordetella petrii]
MNATVPAASFPAGLDEDSARADIYGLLARLYYAPPSQALLQPLRDAPAAPPGSLLEASWNALAECARQMDTRAVQAEYDALFGGVGKPEVYLFASHYLAGFLNEKPLVALRGDLAALGLERDPSVSDTEDHIAYLCEIMRMLATGQHGQGISLDQQKAFFRTHLHPWIDDLCSAIIAQPAARFYAGLAEVTRDFANIEAQGFDMLP